MLRNYQAEMCESVAKAWTRHRSVMAQMPTGTGKTVVLAELVQRLVAGHESDGQILIVAHRRELIEQINSTIQRMGIGCGNITVDSIQTISRRLASRNNTGSFATSSTIGQDGFSLVIIDEAHHALAKTYRQMWEAWPKAKFLGLTATPCRLNGRGFTDLFDVLVQSWDIPTFIKEKWLATYDFVSIRQNSHTHKLIESLKKRGADGDFQNKEMDAVLNKRPSIERLYQSFSVYGKGRKGLVYAINISHARSIADYYQEQGVRAVAIDSRTSSAERERLVSSFRKGDIRVLVNVDIFSEGFDCPDVEVIQLARPTLSLAKYLQMVGRGLRVTKGKKNCMIIDNVGLYRILGLPSQVWNWNAWFRGMKWGRGKGLNFFDGLRVDGLDGLRDVSLPMAHESLSGSELFLVVSHEQLDATFEQQKKDDELEKRRIKLMNGAFGKVRVVGKQLVELQESSRRRPVYVDLTNMNSFRNSIEGKPVVVRLGNVDFLKCDSRLYSRTRTPVILPYFFKCIEKYSFYSEHVGVGEKNNDCIEFCNSQYRYGSSIVVFLYDSPMDYYWRSSNLIDGGLVVMSPDGCYYHVENGKPKVYLGCGDTEENKNRLIQTVLALIKDVNKRYQERRDGFRSNIESLECVKPYCGGVKWGLWGSGGRVLVPPVYRNMREENGFFPFEELPLHWGVMNKFGTILVEPKYDKVEVTADGKAIMTSVTGKQTVVVLSEIDTDG